MSESYAISNVMFRGILNNFDEDDDDDDEIDIGELDARATGLITELNRIQPYRFPRLQTDYLGNNGDAELIFKFRITWMDRTSDLENYLDDVQSTIENGLDILIHERESLGITTE